MRPPQDGVRTPEELGNDDSCGGFHQCEVGEGLREVAEVPAGAGVELLRVEPERRADAEEPLHQVAGALHLADDGERGHEPERADEECSFLAGEPVVGLIRVIAEDEAVLGQLVGDRLYGGAEALVVARRNPKIAASRTEASRASVA